MQTEYGAPIDTTTAADKLVFGIFAALAEFEGSKNEVSGIGWTIKLPILSPMSVDGATNETVQLLHCRSIATRV